MNRIEAELRWVRSQAELGAESKKWENHELTFALFVAWYNFCRVT